MSVIPTRRLLCIGGGLGAAEVGSRIGKGRIHTLLFYPYYGYLSRVRARSSPYLLDARRGNLSTADPFEVEWVDAPARDVLEASFDKDHAARLARRYVPGRVVAETGLVHKPFWVVSADSQRFLLDAQSARIHPLPTG